MKIDFYSPEFGAELALPLFASGVAAGFPSPSDDYIEKSLDLNEHLIKHPAATFYARANGSSLVGRGIYDGDILVVDRSVKATHGAIVVAALDGQLTCKILDLHRRCLESANPNMKPIPIPENADLVIEGVVIHSIRQHVCAS